MSPRRADPNTNTKMAITQSISKLELRFFFVVVDNGQPLLLLLLLLLLL